MYISFHKIQLPGMVCILIHLMSRLSEEFPQLLQKYLHERMDPVSELYDPSFPWDSARLILLYHGLQELPDSGRITLPDGRANVKKKVGQCLKKTRPPTLEKNLATWPKNA